MVRLRDCLPVDTGVLLVCLKVIEDGDVGELFAISMGVKGQQEGPLQAHEAPHTRQVQTGGISEGLLAWDGDAEEGDERYDGQHRENDTHGHEELQAL